MNVCTLSRLSLLPDVPNLCVVKTIFIYQCGDENSRALEAKAGCFNCNSLSRSTTGMKMQARSGSVEWNQQQKGFFLIIFMASHQHKVFFVLPSMNSV